MKVNNIQMEELYSECEKEIRELVNMEDDENNERCSKRKDRREDNEWYKFYNVQEIKILKTLPIETKNYQLKMNW